MCGAAKLVLVVVPVIQELVLQVQSLGLPVLLCQVFPEGVLNQLVVFDVVYLVRGADEYHDKRQEGSTLAANGLALADDDLGLNGDDLGLVGDQELCATPFRGDRKGGLAPFDDGYLGLSDDDQEVVDDDLELFDCVLGLNDDVLEKFHGDRKGGLASHGDDQEV